MTGMTDAAGAPAIAGADPWDAEEGEGRDGASRRPSDVPLLSVEGFEGPVDFLLEMVRRHRVDLARLSILDLIGQLVAALEDRTGRVALERRGDWLVMAAELVLLRAKLIAPATPEAAAAAEADARWRIGRLEELALMRAVAGWIGARPRLGQDVFGRGRREGVTQPRGELLVAFLEATLVMLEGRDGQGAEAPHSYQPSIPALWRIPDAIERMRILLAQLMEPRPLAWFLPEIGVDGPDLALRQRAAVASTLVAGLELARDGVLAAEQDMTFGPVTLAPG